MPSASSIVATTIAATVLVAGTGVAYSAFGGDTPTRGQVIRVIDGDTVDVRYGGDDHRIRLLNVDAPETKHPDEVVECLGPEATDFLTERLQPGDEVRLEFDEELLDRYGRELAGVFEGGDLVNAEVARAGLGVPVLFEPNERFYDEVVAAFEEARESEVGMFSPDAACTLEARAERYADSVTSLEGQAGEPTPENVDAAAAAADEGTELLALIDAAEPGSLAAAGMPRDSVSELRSRVAELRDRAAAVVEERQAEVARIAEEAREKAAAKKAREEAEAEHEAEEKAREEEQARRAAEQAAAEQAAAEAAAAEEARRAEAARQQQPAPQQPAAPNPAPAPDPQPAPSPEPPAARPGAGYTGCRAYVGGPYIDDQGRAYTPIDCETKQPINP